MPSKTGDTKTIQDGFGRTWEGFIDQAYYNMYCVRVTDEWDIDNPLFFHFQLPQHGIEFMELLKKSF